MSRKGGGSDDVTPAALASPGPHPLARALAASFDDAIHAPRVLLLGIGSGRNVPILLEAGARVDAVEDDAERATAAAVRFANEHRVRIMQARYDIALPYEPGFAAALSTHALLHGLPSEIARAISCARERLAPSAVVYATLGSKRDPRFGTGRMLAPDTFAPETGSESGVPHAYFDETGVRALFAAFALDEILERAAGDDVGGWAHAPDEARGIVHWFVRARLCQ